VESSWVRRRLEVALTDGLAQQLDQGPAVLGGLVLTLAGTE
jgi:hypothetical protein